jgi:signal peptidase I
MSPTLLEGDIVAYTPIKIEDVKIGDIVVFKSYIHWPDEKIVVHRVSEIKKDSKGNLILETKGDKNIFTDQAGLHVPEPYIRGDHLIGKVLSIGQLPLKIPFVGYIGIWINHGLNSISQSTSSKEPLSYALIFAPLTISIVILVIFIFILSEKSKQLKRKFI